jgi:hypothetical protein
MLPEANVSSSPAHDKIDLNGGTEREGCDSDGRAGREWLDEISRIDFIQDGEIAHVGEIDTCPDDVGEIPAGCRQNCRQIGEDLLGLFLHPARHNLARSRILSNTARYVDEVPGADCRREGAYRPSEPFWKDRFHSR